MWLAVSVSLMVIKRWHCMATLSACPPFLSFIVHSYLSLPRPHPVQIPRTISLLQLLLDFFFFCDLLPQVWKETLSAGVGRLGRPSPGWSERGHRVSKAEDMRSPSLQQGVIRTPSRLKMSLSTSGAPHPSQQALVPWGVG